VQKLFLSLVLKTAGNMFGKFKDALKNVDTDALMAKAAPFMDKAAEHFGAQASTERTTEPTQPGAVEENYGPGGKRRALLIGINYIGQQGELRGCHADVKNMKEYLDEKNAFTEFRILTDDAQNESKPTRANMIEGFKWLVADAQPNDSFFLHYSGHGSHQADKGGVYIF
jgi:Caspase domain